VGGGRPPPPPPPPQTNRKRNVPNLYITWVYFPSITPSLNFQGKVRFLEYVCMQREKEKGRERERDLL